MFFLIVRLAGAAGLALFPTALLAGLRFAAAAAAAGRLLFNGRSLSDSKSDTESSSLPDKFQLLRLQKDTRKSAADFVNNKNRKNKCIHSLTLVASPPPEPALLFVLRASLFDPLHHQQPLASAWHSACT